MTMHFGSAIRPEVMDPEELDRLQTVAVCTFKAGDACPVFSANDVHALLCHLAAREDVIAVLRKELEAGKLPIHDSATQTTCWPKSHKPFLGNVGGGKN